MPALLNISRPLGKLRALSIKLMRPEKIPYQATLPGFELPAPPWYLTLLRICLDTVIQVVCGLTLAVVWMVILHYLGYDGPEYPQE